MVKFSLLGSSQKTLGSTVMPVVLKDKDTGKRFIIKLYAHVVPNLLMGMFISASAPYIRSWSWDRIYGLEFDDKVVYVGGA